MSSKSIQSEQMAAEVTPPPVDMSTRRQGFDVAFDASFDPPVDMSTRRQGFDVAFDASFDIGGVDNADKNVAWNVSFDGTTHASPLMDAKIWPVLSKPTLKSTSDSVRTVADGSISPAKVVGSTSLPHNPNSTPIHVPRQKSMRRGGDNLPSPQGIDDGFVSLPNIGNEHQHQTHSFRRGNGGPHPRGNAFRYHGGGKRVDQDRRNWNFNSNFSDKDTNLQRASTGSFPGPPAPVSFPNMFGRPVVGPFSYHDMPASVYSAPLYSTPGPYPELYRDFRPSQAMPPMIHPYVDPELNARILQQIEYYFSNDNLARTTHLRENMDSHGWVPIKLIAGFNKVKQLTNNIPLILDVLRPSPVVEVEGEKVRRRHDWQKWLLPPSFSGYTLSNSGSTNSGSIEDMLSANLQRTSLEDV